MDVDCTPAYSSLQFYLQTYGIGLDGLHNNTRTFIEQINVIIEDSLPDVEFGAYAGYVE